jgi:hypothetical protein
MCWIPKKIKEDNEPNSAREEKKVGVPASKKPLPLERSKP